MARTFKTMLNNSRGSGNPCVVAGLRGKAFSMYVSAHFLVLDLLCRCFSYFIFPA